MNQKNSAFKVAEYLFHLNNANDENGMMANEQWTLATVTLAQKLVLEHTYYPTVSVEVAKADVADFTDAVLRKIQSSYPKIKIKNQTVDIEPMADHLVAYSLERIRR